MERCDYRLYSVPLSLEALKILEALHTQRREVTKQINRCYKHNPLLENGLNGSKRESSQACKSLQQENTHLPLTYDLSYCQTSEALNISQPSQASHNSWEPLPCSQTNQSGSNYHLMHMYSQRNNHEPSVLQSSQALPFSQCDVSQTDTYLSQVDRCTTSLHTLQSPLEHQNETWNRSEETTPQITIEHPSKNPDELFQNTPDLEGRTEKSHFPFLEMNSLVKDKIPSTPKDSNCPTSEMFLECEDNHIFEKDTHLLLVNQKINLSSMPSNATKECDVEVEENTRTSASCFDITPSATAPDDGSKIMMPSKMPYQPPSEQFFTMNRKYDAPQPQPPNISSKPSSTKRPPKWEPPRSCQELKRETRKEMNHRETENSLEGQQQCNKLLTDVAKHVSASPDCTPPKQSKYISKPGKPGDHKEIRNKTNLGSLTSSLKTDQRVIEVSKMNQEEIDCIVKKMQTSEALVLTMVFCDGTTLLDPEQKLASPVSGLLLLIKTDLGSVSQTLRPNDSLLYFSLEHAPAWAQQPTPQHQQTVKRDLLLQVFLGSRLLVCYKAKDLLRVVLQFYKTKLTCCQLHDPQVSGWLLNPADPAPCFQDLLNKHCRIPHTIPALGSKKVSQIIASLYDLYRLNRALSSELQSEGLWGLYLDMELKMIPVLAAMEVCHIHVDKEALKTTSEVLGTKMRQLEQEAHKAVGQKFLLTSSTQLRTVLFEKLRLHERCENKKLPKTINKQQSTSEAALLQLRDLHPLPNIILEYRQIHKIKSTFVDGILSCMMTKNCISSTWYQTSAVTGRISAKHPNFQALPKQPLQVTRKQYITGKNEEVVAVHPRAMFIPKEGWTFLSADFCQVELRLLTHLSSDPELLRIFTNPEADVFCILASQWKGVSETEVTSEDREHAKRVVYSVVYGAGSERLSRILGVKTEEARQLQDSFLQTYKKVQTFIQKTVTECQSKGYVLSIMGRRRTLHNINSPDWGIRMQAERQAVNFVVQGSAADLCKMAMIRIFNLLSTSSSLSARLIAQLHDELLYEVEDSQVEEFAAVVKGTMESLIHIDQLGIHLKVPLKVAVSSGKSWGSMSELAVPRTSF